jgi:hypothetical protein
MAPTCKLKQANNIAPRARHCLMNFAALPQYFCDHDFHAQERPQIRIYFRRASGAYFAVLLKDCVGFGPRGASANLLVGHVGELFDKAYALWHFIFAGLTT